jgi:hypothetical protein
MRRVVVPFVAAMVVLAIAASPISAKTSRTRSRAGRKSIRRRRVAPTTASRVLPTLMNAASGIDAPLITLATNAASATAGHRRRP